MRKNQYLFPCIFLFIFLTTNVKAWQVELSIIGKSKGDTMSVYVSNTQEFPQSLSLKLQFSDMKLIGEVPEYIVIPPKAEDYVVAKLFMTNKAAAKLNWNNTQYFMGDINAVHNDKYIYTLPYQKGSSFMASKPDNNDAGSPNNMLRFEMDKGTSVRAARNGKVIMTRSDSETGCPVVDCANFANYIIIMHNDGTMAAYSHLMKDGVNVKPGDEVRAGAVIGKSGNTGWSSFPHLQFEVFKANLTVATKFRTSKKTSGYLEHGMNYKSR